MLDLRCFAVLETLAVYLDYYRDPHSRNIVRICGTAREIPLQNS